MTGLFVEMEAPRVKGLQVSKMYKNIKKGYYLSITMIPDNYCRKVHENDTFPTGFHGYTTYTLYTEKCKSGWESLARGTSRNFYLGFGDDLLENLKAQIDQFKVIVDCDEFMSLEQGKDEILSTEFTFSHR